MTTPTPTRTVDGVDLPASGTWQLDPGHTEVAFIGRHFMLTRIRGRFGDVTASVEIGERPEDSRVTATIQTASVESGSTDRDDHLRSDDLLDVAAHPTITFTSTSIAWDGATGTLTGDLTIKGVTRSVTLDTELLGTIEDPWGGTRTVFSATTRINREDFGVTWNMLMESGGVVLSKQIDIQINAELIRS